MVEARKAGLERRGLDCLKQPCPAVGKRNLVVRHESLHKHCIVNAKKHEKEGKKRKRMKENTKGDYNCRHRRNNGTGEHEGARCGGLIR